MGPAVTRGSPPPLLAAATVGLAACPGGRGAADEAQAPAGAQAVVGAGTAGATSQPFPQIVRAIGTVAPRPGRFAELAPPGPPRGARVWGASGPRGAGGGTPIRVERGAVGAAAP